MKKYLVATLALAMTFAAGTALAFHSGGVAECEGCHTMHNSLEGQAMDADMAQYEAGPYLLQGSDMSSACLNCHDGPTLSGYHVSSIGAADGVPKNWTPGGDFTWVQKTYTYVVRGATLTNHGERHGHNVVAVDFGYTADPTITEAPGGTYPADNLSCGSCHDPHGRARRFVDGSISVPALGDASLPIKNSGSYNTSADPTAWGAVGVYRILGGLGYKAMSEPSVTFGAQAPAAVAPSSYNRSESASDTRVAYGSGMSEWCANCHGSMLMNNYTSGMAGLVHPAGNDGDLGAAIAANYNAYKKSGDLSGVAGPAAYTSLAPFEIGTTDYTAMKAFVTSGPTNGAEATNNVNCLSCHRAHASGFESMLRFPHAYEFMTGADAAGNPIYVAPTATNGVYTSGLPVADYQAALYDRPATAFAPFQRLLCNKCHAKD
jgi:hypothetical protein